MLRPTQKRRKRTVGLSSIRCTGCRPTRSSWLRRRSTRRISTASRSISLTSSGSACEPTRMKRASPLSVISRSMYRAIPWISRSIRSSSSLMRRGSRSRSRAVRQTAFRRLASSGAIRSMTGTIMRGRAITGGSHGCAAASISSMWCVSIISVASTSTTRSRRGRVMRRVATGKRAPALASSTR